MVLRSCVRNEHWGQYGYSMRETTSNKRRHGGWRRRGCTQAERQAPPTKLHAIATQLIWTPIKHVPSGCFTPALERALGNGPTVGGFRHFGATAPVLRRFVAGCVPPRRFPE